MASIRKEVLIDASPEHVWSAVRDVYAYFNNDGYGHAVRNAMALRSLLGE